MNPWFLIVLLIISTAGALMGSALGWGLATLIIRCWGNPLTYLTDRRLFEWVRQERRAGRL